MDTGTRGLYRLETVLTGWTYVRVKDHQGREYEVTDAQYRALGLRPELRDLPLRFAAGRSPFDF